MRRGPLVAVCCALLLLLAGCAGAGGGGDAAEQGDGALTAQADAAAEATPAEAEAGAGEAAGDAATGVKAQVAERALIYEAEVRLRVDDYESASEDLTAIARERGGYVERTTQEVHGEENRTWTTGRMVLRIPTGNYSGGVEQVRARGEVRSFHESTTDVTDQVVDLRARLKSLRAERDRLRELYDQANDTEDVLAVQRELSDVQTEIERTEAKLRSLERRVAYSTIVIQLEEPRPDYEPLERTEWYETPVTQAFLESIDGVIVLGRGLIVLTAYALPYLGVLAIPGVGVAVAYRYVRG